VHHEIGEEFMSQQNTSEIHKVFFFPLEENPVLPE
jgi:hypothetical protein